MIEDERENEQEQYCPACDSFYLESWENCNCVTEEEE